MDKQPVSIFNDVIGPVMRGPSSSHSAAAARIGKLVKQMAGGDVRAAVVEFDKNSALAATYHGHGSDFGFAGGLLGYDPEDEAILTSLAEAEHNGIKISFVTMDIGTTHPNTYRITAQGGNGMVIHLIALSTGGGMVEITEIEGAPVSIQGGFHEAVILMPFGDLANSDELLQQIDGSLSCQKECYTSRGARITLIGVRTEERIPEELLTAWRNDFNNCAILQLEPVMPIHSRFGCSAPFQTARQMLEISQRRCYQLWELAVLYEAEIGRVSADDVFARMEKIVGLMKGSVHEGLRGTRYEDRILGPQSMLISRAALEGKLFPGDVMNSVIACISSMMEVKSSMGLVVAAPTAGSCGVLPGTIIGAARAMGLNDVAITKALLAAGIIGVFIAAQSGFSAEVGGCQLECGAASGMAAAALVQLMRGSPEQGADAASMAIQNVLGMICDPVGNRVEVPCLGKNVMAGMNALACANMALAGFDKVIPLDETLDAMRQVGAMLPQELRCTSRGGLSLTDTSIGLDHKLRNERN